MKYLIPVIEKTDYFTGWTTIPGELLTQNERDRRFRYLYDEYFMEVNIPKKKTYFFLGRRYAYDYEVESKVIY